MKALIRSEHKFNNVKRFFKKDLLVGAWIVSSDIASIFKADDKGEAILLEDDVGLVDLQEILKAKNPAPPGSSYYAIVNNNYLLERDTVWEFSIPVISGKTSFEDAMAALEETGTLIFNSSYHGFQKWIEPYREYDKTSYTKDGGEIHVSNADWYQTKCDDLIVLKRDPKRVKRLLSYIQREKKPKKKSIKEVSVGQLRELYNELCRLIISPSTGVLTANIDFKYRHKGGWDYWHHNKKLVGQLPGDRKKYYQKVKEFLIQEILHLNALAKRLKIKPSDKLIHQLSHLFPFIQTFEASDKDYHVAFSKWLKQQQKLTLKSPVELQDEAENSQKPVVKEELKPKIATSNTRSCKISTEESSNSTEQLATIPY